MSLLPPLAPNFDAALRDVSAKGRTFRFASAQALGAPPPGREDEARRGLAALARDDDPRIRAAALLSASRIPDEALVPLVDEALESLHPLVVDPALELAAALGPPGESRIVAALGSTHGDVRFAAARALALSRFEGAGDALLAAFPDPDDAISAQIARALGDLGVDEAADALAGALGSSSRALADAAAFALGDLGDARAAPRLIAALDRRETLPDAALLLAKLGRRDAVAPLERHASRLLLPALDRAFVLGALVRLGGRVHAEARLARMLRSIFPTKRAVAAHAVIELSLREMLPAVRDAVRRGRLPRSVGEDVEASLAARRGV